MTMTESLTFGLFVASLVVLLLVLMVLLLLCWILKHNRNKLEGWKQFISSPGLDICRVNVLKGLCGFWLHRNLTELRISTGQPTRQLTIRTKPDHADQLLDHLLDRVFLQVEVRPQSVGESAEENGPGPGEELGPEPGEEPGPEPGEELGPEPGEEPGEQGSEPDVSTAPSVPSKTFTALHNKLRNWMTVAAPPQSASTLTASADEDQTNNPGPQQSDASQHSSSSSQGASCSA